MIYACTVEFFCFISFLYSNALFLRSASFLKYIWETIVWVLPFHELTFSEKDQLTNLAIIAGVLYLYLLFWFSGCVCAFLLFCRYYLPRLFCIFQRFFILVFAYISEDEGCSETIFLKSLVSFLIDWPNFIVCCIFYYAHRTGSLSVPASYNLQCFGRWLS